MTELRAILTEFVSSPAGVALIGALAAMFADFVTGVFAAIRDGTFQWGAIAAFLRKHAAGRVGPLASLLFIGYYAGEVAGQLFLASAIAGLTAYGVETASSIFGNLVPPKEIDTAAVATARAAGEVVPAANPVPQE